MTEENNVNFNITPEMINNLLKKFKNDTINNNSPSNTPTSTSHNSGDTSESTNNYNGNSYNNFDLDTILKMKNIIDTMNKKDDPRSNLLYSLKPYLRESKRQKMDQYINLLKFTDITEFFKIPKGDSNK